MAETTQTPTPEQAAAALAAAQQLVIKPSANFRIETKTGAVFEGQTEQEVLQKLVQSVESGSEHIKQMRSEIGTLKQQVQQAPTQQRPTGPEQKSIQDQYWEIWQTDPIKADRFAESVRLGVPMDQVDQIQRGTMQAAAVSQQQTAATEFMSRCPDFPEGDAEAAKALATGLAQRFPNQMPTADHLELVYNGLVRSGTIAPKDVAISEVVNPSTPLPRLGGSTQQQQTDFMQQFRSLNADQQKKVINELYSKGLR